MSQDAVKQFLDKLRSDPALQHEVSGMLERSEDPEVMPFSEFAAVAARHGFEISRADIEWLGSGEELSMDELDSVTGGSISAEPQYYSIELVNASISESSKLVNATLGDIADGTSNTLPGFKLRL